MPVHPQGGTDSSFIIPDRAAATAVRSSVDLDTRGASYATIRVQASSGATTDSAVCTLSLLEGTTTDTTNFTTLVADATIATASTAANEKTYHVDLRGKERYLRLTSTPGTVATDDAITVGAIATLSRQGEWPSALADLSDTAGVIVV